MSTPPHPPRHARTAPPSQADGAEGQYPVEIHLGAGQRWGLYRAPQPVRLPR
jgi:hypothetical protein